MTRLKNLPQYFPYPEILVSLGILVFLAGHAPSPLYHLLAIGLIMVSVLWLLTTLFVPITTRHAHRATFDLIHIVTFSITIGVLQLTYLPTLCLWLLLFYRLMLSKKAHILAYALVAMLVTGVTYLTSFTYLPTLNFSPDNQLLFNQISMFLTAITFAIQLWYLLLLIEHFRNIASEQQDKITRLVSVTNKLTRFMPPQIWQPIIRTNKPVTVTNQRKKLTILFSDIAGFTELSDELSSDHLADILNTYFEHMTKITHRYNATLDKFIGDGMLCFFGDQQSEGEKADAIKCANMALEMRQSMRVLRSQWRLLGFEGLYIRIGINTGYCHVGNFGSSQRMAYTVIGKAANLASRLESAAEKNQVLLSETTYDLISSEHHCQLAQQYQFKGLREPVPVWELLDPKEHRQASNWLNSELPGFNLHLNFNDIKNYDEKKIRKSLLQALERLEAKKLS